MELFGRELSLEQMVGLVECNATPDEDLVHRAALEIIAALRESQRKADAAVEDLKANWLCQACSKREKGKEWAWCKHGDFVTDGERVVRCSHFDWRGPQDEKGDTE